MSTSPNPDEPIGVEKLDRVPANAKLVAVQGPDASLYQLRGNLGVLHRHDSGDIFQINIQSVLARGYWTAVDENGQPITDG